MAEAAGRVADGISGHPMTSPRYIVEVIRPAIERGAASVGRDPSEVNLTTNLVVQVDPDGDLARREAALQLGFYATTRTYAPVLAMHGLEGLVGTLRKAYVKGDTAAMADIAMPLVEHLAVAGTPEEAREGIRAFEGVVDRVILGNAWVGPDPARLRSTYELLLETFAPARG
jgi:alkanesulfonate monooxygenase SsuD/methylene tetrahydromethanopterin reductase-like flavin-dependent oxidoreductase (luciferase family)